MHMYAIIPPRNSRVFSEKQGRMFRNGYKYVSSAGIKLRSQNECFWHFFLSALGIAHTYEPELPPCEFRPDFGVANNFLLEICGARPGNKLYGKGFDEISEHLAAKRGRYLQLGYNIVEIYKDRHLINGRFVPYGLIDIILQHNPDCRQKPEIVRFTPRFKMEPKLYLHSRDMAYWRKLQQVLETVNGINFS